MSSSPTGTVFYGFPIEYDEDNEDGMDILMGKGGFGCEIRNEAFEYDNPEFYLVVNASVQTAWEWEVEPVHTDTGKDWDEKLAKFCAEHDLEAKKARWYLTSDYR